MALKQICVIQLKVNKSDQPLDRKRVEQNVLLASRWNFQDLHKDLQRDLMETWKIFLAFCINRTEEITLIYQIKDMKT